MKMVAKSVSHLLQQFVTSSKVDFTHELKSIFKEQLTQLSVWFENYFPRKIEKFARIQDPFKSKAPFEFSPAKVENLIELSYDKTLKTKFGSMELTEFWISVKDEYMLLSAKAQRILIPFSTSYLCEAGFSAVAVIKRAP
ncbi:protein FAM200A-like [Tachypleus tridentatus]|uniref:protein FAM200A-like n=1 Tax=Tachypleus tridentatus TaxID=6853 RepID=UPI003FD04516